MDASMASDPEFQKKNESRDGCGIFGRSFSMRRAYGSWRAMLHYFCYENGIAAELT
jgi:hypothetical protein